MKMPVVPGHAATNELLAFFVNPCPRFDLSNRTVTAAVDITSLANRKTFIVSVQSIGRLWMNFDAPAAAGVGLLLTGGMFGLDLAESVSVSLFGEGAGVDVAILQLGGE